MKDKKKKHTPEERVCELINRFYQINNKIDTSCGTNPYISKEAAALCALELINENLYIYNNPCQMNTYHSQYWENAKLILENIIRHKKWGDIKL